MALWFGGAPIMQPVISVPAVDASWWHCGKRHPCSWQLQKMAKAVHRRNGAVLASAQVANLKTFLANLGFAALSCANNPCLGGTSGCNPCLGSRLACWSAGWDLPSAETARGGEVKAVPWCLRMCMQPKAKGNSIKLACSALTNPALICGQYAKYHRHA